MMRAKLRRNAWPRGPDVSSLSTLVGKAQFAQTVRSYRVRSGQEMVEKHSETVDIAADGGCLPRQELGRQVERRAGETSGGVVAQLASRAEVHQHEAPIVSQHHVLGFDVAMQKTGVVHGSNRATELDADLDSLSYSEAPALLEDLFERTSLDELHPQADLASDTLRAVDGHDVRVANLRQQAAFFDDRARARLAGSRVCR